MTNSPGVYWRLVLPALLLSACGTNSGSGDAGPRPDAGSDAGQCVTDFDCGQTPCASRACGVGACDLCAPGGTCTRSPVPSCSSGPVITVIDAGMSPLQGELIAPCCSFDGGFTSRGDEFQVSPDGTHVAVEAPDQLLVEELFVGVAGQSGSLPVAASTGYAVAIDALPFPAPGFSADSTRLTARFKQADGGVSLWLAHADGTAGSVIDEDVDSLFPGGGCLLYSTRNGSAADAGVTLRGANWSTTTPAAPIAEAGGSPLVLFTSDGQRALWFEEGMRTVDCSDPSTGHGITSITTASDAESLSPDGTQLLYAVENPSDATGLTVMKSAWDGSNPQVLGSISAQLHLRETGWSPDGKAISFTTSEGDSYFLHVRVLATGAEWVSPALPVSTNFSWGRFTPDSAHFVYEESGSKSSGLSVFGVAVGAPAGTAPTRYGSGVVDNWDVSNQWVAELLSQESTTDTLAVWPIEGGPETVISTDALSINGPSILFSPDGENLAFVSSSGPPGEPPSPRISVVALGGQSVHPIALAQGADATAWPGFAWGQRGWLLAQYRETNWVPWSQLKSPLYLLKADGSAAGQLSELATWDWFVTPDGSAAYYLAEDGVRRLGF